MENASLGFSRVKMRKLNILCIIEANPKVYNKFVVNFGEVVVFYLTVRFLLGRYIKHKNRTDP